ncbi:hypothetical protein DRO56_03455 [Candidatus Bathyarchaeota archaeon]|nr:hypothetical protein [Candidatus Bathyarchaeota archaeon]RJS90207.1 MAG: hypothetical protein CW700_01310 [Candidatus Bathyarchaeota archaeon]RLI32479.1 MAG: hypothetical protein DRO56_03455 [Candidatus Bathyarchaeota archaeon]
MSKEKEILPPEFFVEESKRLVDEAQEEGLIIRIMGALAIWHHSPEYHDLHRRLGRLGEQVFTDIDFMALNKQRKQLVKFFEKRGYTIPLTYRLHLAQLNRYILTGEKIYIDLFFDKLDMCHCIDFRKRLTLDYPTITLADIVLEKMQIVEITEKDIKDTMVLLRAHDVGETDKEMVNGPYIAKLLAKDWGFWYTVTTNLDKVKKLLSVYDVLTDEDRRIIASRIDKLREYIDREPKTMGWKMRAKIGTKKKWYKEVGKQRY